MNSEIRSFFHLPRLGTRPHITGFTLVETVIALALVTVVVMGSLSLIGNSAASMKKSTDLSWRNIENDEMIKLLTEPTYFGTLAGYNPNSKLSECMMADDVKCTQGTDYPLTAFDLKSGEIISTISRATVGAISNTLTFQVHCQNNAETCDQAIFFIVKVITSARDLNGNITSVEKTAMVVPKIPNMVSFIPDTTISLGRPINVLLFIDASGSLAAEKAKIEVSLDGLLSKLSMMDVTLGIFPLTGTLDTSQSYIIDGSGNKSNVNVSALNPDSTFYYKSILDWDYGHNYILGEGIVETDYRTIMFSQSDSGAVRTTKIAAARGLIDYLFAHNSPSQADTPLCGLLRYLEQPNAIFPIDPMTPTVTMIVSNEDDESILANTAADIDLTGPNGYNFSHAYCVQQLDRKLKKGSGEYQYFGDSMYYRVTYTSDRFDDGAVLPNIQSTAFVIAPYSPLLIEGNDCLSAPNLSSTVESALIAGEPDYRGNLKISSCVLEKSYFTFFSNPTSTTLCAPNEPNFSVEDPGYIPNSCWVKPHNLAGTDNWDATTTEIVSIAPMVPADVDAHASKDIVKAVYNSIQARLNVKNFYYIPVIHGSSTGCALTPGARIGARYEELATKLGMAANITPICSVDYTAPIAKIQGLLDKIGAADITVPTWLAPKITGIEINRDGTILHPARDIDYKIDGGIVMFTIDYLHPSDIIRVFFQ